MARAYGSNAALLLKRATTYGVAPTGNFLRMPFTRCSLGSEQGLIADPVLGYGRDPRQPLLDVINDDGDIVVPVDPRYFGVWLTGLFGDPTTAAVAAGGSIRFAALPAARDTITINGVVFTFRATAPAANEILVGATLPATLTNITTELNANVDPDVAAADYGNNGVDTVTVTHATPGLAGNAFTLAASAATVSAATLQGGGYRHTFVSGVSALPSYAIEVGMPEVPACFLHLGCMLNSISLEFARSGPAAATVNVIAQGEERNNTSQGGTPSTLPFDRISQFQGSIKRAGSAVANLTGGTLVYSNNMERIETIRSDGKIDGADPTIASLTGRVDVRFADTAFIDFAAGGEPVDLEFAYTLSANASVVFTAHEVYLPKPKLTVDGPGGVQASFDFQGAWNEAEGAMVQVTLTNDLVGTLYG